MARKPRDYRAEEARRNARARAYGYTSRAQLRKERARGAAPSAAHLRQRTPEARRWEAFRKAGFRTQAEYEAARREAKRWSDRVSIGWVSRYDPTGRHKSPESFRMYYDTFVNPDTRYGVKDETEEVWKIRDDYFRYMGYEPDTQAPY